MDSRLATMKRSFEVATATPLPLRSFAEEPVRKRLRSYHKSVEERSRRIRRTTRRVRFAPQLVQYRVIPSFNEEDRRTSFYSDEDYTQFFVREKSRIAIMKLTIRICMEQERRLRNRIQAIPSYFIAINYLHAMLTINQLRTTIQTTTKKKKDQRPRGQDKDSLLVLSEAATSSARLTGSGSVSRVDREAGRIGRNHNHNQVVQKLPERNTVTAACA
eukprot:scaffold3380_cov106-Cylindrotheca_fusiformis.AAC.1